MADGEIVKPVANYQIQLPLAGHDDKFTLCNCDTPEAVAEVVKVLLRVGAGGPQEVTVKVHYV